MEGASVPTSLQKFQASNATLSPSLFIPGSPTADLDDDVVSELMIAREAAAIRRWQLDISNTYLIILNAMPIREPNTCGISNMTIHDGARVVTLYSLKLGLGRSSCFTQYAFPTLNCLCFLPCFPCP